MLSALSLQNSLVRYINLFWKKREKKRREEKRREEKRREEKRREEKKKEIEDILELDYKSME